MLNRVQTTRDVRRKLVTAWDPSIAARKKAKEAAARERKYRFEQAAIIDFACRVTRSRTHNVKIGDVYAEVKGMVRGMEEMGLPPVSVIGVIRHEIHIMNGILTKGGTCRIYREREGIKYEYQ